MRVAASIVSRGVAAVNPALRQAGRQRGLGIVRLGGVVKPVFAQQWGDFGCHRLPEPFRRVGDVCAGRRNQRRQCPMRASSALMPVAEVSDYSKQQSRRAYQKTGDRNQPLNAVVPSQPYYD